jgi:hypothetical protein
MESNLAQGKSSEGQPRLARGRVLAGGAALAAAAAALGAHSIAAAQSGQRERPERPEQALALEVSCDGRTQRWDSGAVGTGLRGATFVVNGKIFPAGTFAKGPTGPDSPGSIGTWVCRGTLYFDLAEIAQGKEPHAATTQFFLFDDGSQLVTEGVEGGAAEFTRLVAGGTGRYRGTRGQVTEREVGTNPTLLKPAPGVEIPAPNFVFRFSFEKP